MTSGAQRGSAAVPAGRSAEVPLARRPALWLLVALIAAGAWRVGVLLHHAFAAYPRAATVAVVLFTLYAVPFVLLLRMIDYLDREPVAFRVAAVAWGGLVATSAALSGSTALQDLLAKLASPQVAAVWGPAVAGAAVEEVLKALGVVVIALVARARITSVVDGFVYGALVGLGFQVVEDVAFSVNAVALESGSDAVGPVIVTFLLRGFLGGLWSHTLFTALAGAGIAFALVRTDRSRPVRMLVAAALLFAAWGFHFGWNSPLLADGFGYGVPGVIAAMLLKGVPALLVGVVLIVTAERREAGYYGALLAGLADNRVATRAEIAALISPRRRLAARRQASIRLGHAGVRAMRRLQRAQARLAVALAQDPGALPRAIPRAGTAASQLRAARIAATHQGDEPAAEVLRRRRDVLSRRHALLALSLAAHPVRSRRTRLALRMSAAVAEIVVVVLLVVGLGVAVRALGGT